MTAPTIDLNFPHEWQAEILPARPLILPRRHYVYPREAEEVERGALEVLITPLSNHESKSQVLKEHDVSPVEPPSESGLVTGHDFSRAANAEEMKLGFSPCCVSSLAVLRFSATSLAPAVCS